MSRAGGLVVNGLIRVLCAVVFVILGVVLTLGPLAAFGFTGGFVASHVNLPMVGIVVFVLLFYRRFMPTLVAALIGLLVGFGLSIVAVHFIGAVFGVSMGFEGLLVIAAWVRGAVSLMAVCLAYAVLRMFDRRRSPTMEVGA